MMILRKNKIIILGIILVFAICLSRYNLNQDMSIQTSTTGSKYKIFVDIEDSKLYLFQDEELIKIYTCSGGKWSTPSPIGTWTIISKAKWGEGFGRKLDGIKCTMGTVWNSWNFRARLTWVGKFTWMYKDGK